MKPFLTEYQYKKPMMSFMYDDLLQLLRDIVTMYILPLSENAATHEFFVISTSVIPKIIRGIQKSTLISVLIR